MPTLDYFLFLTNFRYYTKCSCILFLVTPILLFSSSVRIPTHAVPTRELCLRVFLLYFFIVLFFFPSSRLISRQLSTILYYTLVRLYCTTSLFIISSCSSSLLFWRFALTQLLSEIYWCCSTTRSRYSVGARNPRAPRAEDGKKHFPKREKRTDWIFQSSSLENH